MIRKIILFIVLFAVVVGLFFGVRFFLNRQKTQGKSGLQVKSDPPSSVFLDSRFLGRTPYEDRIEPGEYTLKLIPESTATTTASWQGKITLEANILTYINRLLGTSDLTSSGEIISLEKLSGKDTEVSIITNPDGAQIKIDNQDKGTAPILVRNIEPGEHDVLVFSPGFVSKSIKIKATVGFKLIASVQLAVSADGTTQDKEQTPTDTNPTPSTSAKAVPKTSDPDKPYVVILDTPTGWLRVRNEPSTTASESGKVNPKEKYKLLEEQSGWYKIQMNGSEGWISGKYAEKFE